MFVRLSPVILSSSAFTLAELSHKYLSNFGAKLSHKLKTDVHISQIEKFAID